MKLDRNINPDGKGKYALLNLRKNTVEWGDQTQFFVIKYSDAFAAPALQAYADAVFDRAEKEENPAVRDSLMEYAEEIEREAKAAANWPKKKLPD